MEYSNLKKWHHLGNILHWFSLIVMKNKWPLKIMKILYFTQLLPLFFLVKSTTWDNNHKSISTLVAKDLSVKFAKNFLFFLHYVEDEEEEFFPSMKTLSSFTSRHSVQRAFLILRNSEWRETFCSSSASQIMLPTVSSLPKMLILFSSLRRNFISRLKNFTLNTPSNLKRLSNTLKQIPRWGALKGQKTLSFWDQWAHKIFVTQYLNESRPFSMLTK